MTAANDERTKLGFLHPHEQAPELRTHKYLPSQLQELLSKSRERDRQTLASIAPALTGSGAAAHAVLDAEPETKFSLQVIDTVAEIAATELRPRCGTQSMSCASPPLPAEVATSTNSARVAQAPASTNATTRISIQQPSPSKPASPQPSTTSVAHTASPQSVAQVSPSTVENGRPAWPLRMKAPHIRLVAATTLLAVALA